MVLARFKIAYNIKVMCLVSQKIYNYSLTVKCRSVRLNIPMFWSGSYTIGLRMKRKKNKKNSEIKFMMIDII